MKKKLSLSVLLALTPGLAFAASCAATITTFQDMLCKIGNILGYIVPVLVALGVVYFAWGVVTYVISSDEEAKKSGRDRMIYGIIGLAVIIGMWGLVKILGTTFGVQSGSAGNAGPTLPFTP